MACIQIHSKTVERGSLQGPQNNSIVAATSWACARVKDKHVCVYEFSLVLHENDVLRELNEDMDEGFHALCTLGYFVFCASRLNNDWLNECTTGALTWPQKRPSSSRSHRYPHVELDMECEEHHESLAVPG